MEIQKLQEEIDALKREKKIHDAQNKLFEMFINLARSSSEEQVLKATMQNALDIAAQMSNAEMGSIFLLDTHGVVTDSILTRNQIHGEKRFSLIGKVLDSGLAGWVKNNLQVGLVDDADNDPRWVTFKDQSYVVNSALAVPILRHDTLFGIMTLLHSIPAHFDTICVEVIQKAANQMAIAIENAQLYKKLKQAGHAIEKYSNALRSELDQGRKIQEDFLPCHLPEIKNCEASSHFIPALKLSGDFFDLFELPQDHIGFAIGDVSGKGVGSALFMALTRSLLRIFSGSFIPTSQIAPLASPFSPKNALNAVALINEYIAKEHCDDGIFVTLFFCVIHPSTGKMVYINGGHEPVLVIGKDGVKQSLDATGPALGPVQDASYEIKKVQMTKGELLFGFTDGVTDARSETKGFYSRNRLIKTINAGCRKGYTHSAHSFIESVKQDLVNFTGNAPQSDDITMLAIKWQK
ncbi:MAG: GAF domain-containing SpoIIE family protein phosphatase [Pseudomonadota bacterium]